MKKAFLTGSLVIAAIMAAVVMSSHSAWALVRNPGDNPPVPPTPPAVVIGNIFVVAYGVGDTGGQVHLPVTWTLNGPNNFSDTPGSPIDTKTYTDRRVGSYALSAPMVLFNNKIRYVLTKISPCTLSIPTTPQDFVQSVPCIQDMTDTTVNNPPPAPVVPPANPAPVHPGDRGGFHERQLPLNFHASSIAEGASWLKAADLYVPVALAQTSAPRSISFALYYVPKVLLRPCTCDPRSPEAETEIGSLVIDPSTLFPGTPHTVTVGDAIPNANAILYKTAYEWDANSFRRIFRTQTNTAGAPPVGSNWLNYRTGSGGWPVMPYDETTDPGSWVQLDDAGGFSRSFTNNCGNDGTGVPTKGLRMETDYLDYGGNYISPTAVVTRDCRGTVKIIATSGSPLGINWTLSGWSNWQSDWVLSAPPIPITNTNVNNYSYPGRASLEFQGYVQPNASTISFLATDGTYTMSDLPPYCSVDYPSQPVTPGDTTTFRISCNGGPLGPLTCSPSNQTVARNQPAGMSATGGNGTYAWSAPGGNPQSGSGNSFQPVYGSSGFTTATLTSGNETATCSVNVSQCPSTPTFVINPYSRSIPVNTNASFQGIYNPNPGCGGQDQDVTAQAAWSSDDPSKANLISQGVFHGITVSTVGIAATHQGLTATGLIDITGGFACSVNPNIITVPQGGSAVGVVICQPLDNFTGPITLVPRSTPPVSTLSFDPSTVNIPPDPTNSTYNFQTAPTTPTGAYTMDVDATGGSVVHSYPVQVIVTPSVPGATTLTAILSADPSQGDAPLSTTLSAQVGGSATGPIDYTFWWNCGYSGTSTAAATAACGNPAATYSGSNENPKATPAHPYVAGSYTPRVIVGRGGLFANAVAAVNPVTPCVGSGCGGGGGTHAECVNSTCQSVQNTANNFNDRCAGDASCGGGGGGAVSHGECDAPTATCKNVAGPLPANKTACSDDPACSGSTPSYLACQNNACVILGGIGINTDGCTAVGNACTTTGTSGSCTLTASPNIIKKDQQSTLSWSCTGGGITNCTVIGTSISGGPNGSGKVAPQLTTQYTLSCNDSTNTQVRTTVYVIQSVKEVPPGGGH
jgi:hypothetical protein